MLIKNKKIINVSITAVIIIVVLLILTFGGIPVRRIDVGDMDITESVSEADTKHIETADLQTDAADASSNDSEIAVDDTVCDTQGSAADSGSASYAVAEPEKDIFTENKPAANSIGFGNYTADFYSSSIQLYDPDILDGYAPKYSNCNSYILYSALKTEEERMVYRALEYAYDHQYGTVFFSKDLIGDEVDLDKVFHFYLLDTSMMEESLTYYCLGEPENLTYVTYEYILSGGGRCISNMFGYAVAVKNFQFCDTAKYEEAYNKACEIVASVPTEFGMMQKAEYLYRYLCSHTIYEDKEGDHWNQLYDALILGRCVCDGFANSLSLLYNLAGIPCFEKEYDPKADSGHVWDCFCADGVWYNADPTIDEGLDEGSVLGTVLHGFGFSDKYQKYPYKYNDIVPKCTADTLYANIKYVAKTDTDNVLNTITQSWLDRNRTVGCVLTDPMSKDEFDNGLRTAMLAYDGQDGVQKYYFYKIDYSGFSVLCFINNTDPE